MYYVMSDIHGSYPQMINALKEWDFENEHLVITGDIINKGPDSLKVVRKLMDLKKEFPKNVTVIKGNHEEKLISWIIKNKDEPMKDYPYKETIKSYLGLREYKNITVENVMKDMLSYRKDELTFLKSLPIYLEVENSIFVHAGINLNIADWRKDRRYILWEKRDFIYTNKVPNKRVFFGHTPTTFIHKDRKKNGIWISKDGMKVAIDGRVSSGGQLNVVRVDNLGNIVSTASFK